MSHTKTSKPSIRLVSSLYGMYLALLASPITNSSAIEADPTAELDPSNVDAVRTIVRDAKLNGNVKPLTEGELHEELSIMFGGRPNEVLQHELAKAQGAAAAYRDAAERAQGRAERIANDNGNLMTMLAERTAVITHIVDDMTAAMTGRETFKDMPEADRRDPERLAHKVLETMHSLDKCGGVFATTAMETMRALRQSRTDHKTDLMMIGRSIGMPEEIANAVTIDILIEMLHGLLCPSDGSVLVNGIDPLNQEEQSAARSKMVQEAYMTARAKVKEQQAKGEKTMAELGREVSKMEKTGIGRLLGQLLNSDLDASQKETLSDLTERAKGVDTDQRSDETKDGAPSEEHDCDECKAERGDLQDKSDEQIASERIGRIDSIPQGLRDMLTNLNLRG